MSIFGLYTFSFLSSIPCHHTYLSMALADYSYAFIILLFFLSLYAFPPKGALVFIILFFFESIRLFPGGSLRL